MHPILRNILAVIAGAGVTLLLNGFIISIGPSIIPNPEGTDVSTPEALAASMHLFKPIHFLMPFLAHALGSLAGAFVAAWIAASHKMVFALVIGVLHLLGGIGAVMMLPAPLWFEITDLVLAYIPMAYLGGLAGSRR